MWSNAADVLGRQRKHTTFMAGDRPMIGLDEKPELDFFRRTPDSLMLRPPLCSSLQNLESSFFLIALDRFPHALVTCASAVESAMKSVLNLSPEQFLNAEKLFAKAIAVHPALLSFPPDQLETFRFTRNRIVHYGFSPRDDEESAILLLQIGFPFLSACYKEFFSFDLQDGLAVEFGDQLAIALDVFERATNIPNQHCSYCLSALGHLVRWTVRQSIMADWENEASIRAEETGVKFDRCEKRKSQIERMFGVAQAFNCPICGDIESFMCELDEDKLDEHLVALKRAECANCGFGVRKNCPFLADALCARQIAEKRAEILQDFGITDV
jgi:hypothetical protein